MRGADEGALVVSLCPDRGLPFIARGTYRRGETDLVRVNALWMTVHEAVARLDLADQPSSRQKIVDALLLREAIDEAGLADAIVTDDDLQCSVDRFRRRNGLMTAEQAGRWLAQRGKTLAMLEEALKDDVRVLMLRRRLFEAEVEGELSRRLADYDVIVGTSLVFADESAASAFHERTQAAAADDAAFCRAVVRAAAAGVTAKTGRWRRFACPPALADAAADSCSGTLFERVGSTVYRFGCCMPAQRDDATRVAARDRLFVAWLDDRRRHADIEWFWGTSPQQRPTAAERRQQ